MWSWVEYTGVFALIVFTYFIGPRLRKPALIMATELEVDPAKPAWSPVGAESPAVTLEAAEPPMVPLVPHRRFRYVNVAVTHEEVAIQWSVGQRDKGELTTEVLSTERIAIDDVDVVSVLRVRPLWAVYIGAATLAAWAAGGLMAGVMPPVSFDRLLMAVGIAFGQPAWNRIDFQIVTKAGRTICFPLVTQMAVREGLPDVEPKAVAAADRIEEIVHDRHPESA